MSRTAFSRVLNCRAGISPDLAVRLEQAGVSTARSWLAMQTNYDLWQAMRHKQPPVRRLQEPTEDQIQHMIASDPDAPEATDEQLAQAKPFGEKFPDLADAMRKDAPLGTKQ